MTTATTEKAPQELSPEETEAMLDQLRAMTEEQKKAFLLERRELFAQVKPRTLFFDEVLVV